MVVIFETSKKLRYALEERTVLEAAVMDDVLGLMILAVVVAPIGSEDSSPLAGVPAIGQPVDAWYEDHTTRSQTAFFPSRHQPGSWLTASSFPRGDRITLPA
jgi:hypothetical protein